MSPPFAADRPLSPVLSAPPPMNVLPAVPAPPRRRARSCSPPHSGAPVPLPRPAAHPAGPDRPPSLLPQPPQSDFPPAVAMLDPVGRSSSPVRNGAVEGDVLHDMAPNTGELLEQPNIGSRDELGPSAEEGTGEVSGELTEKVPGEATENALDEAEEEVPEEPTGEVPEEAFEEVAEEAAEEATEEANELSCLNCEAVINENVLLSRRVARLRQRLQDALETAQTHGQRLLRAAYQEKVRELTEEHHLKTTEMLNRQKKCFEDEFELIDAEGRATLSLMEQERDAERAARAQELEAFQNERDAALQKSTATMVAVQRKIGQLHARNTRLEREKKSLETVVSEKQAIVDVLVSAAAARDVERRRVEMLSKTQEDERERKDGLIESLQVEVAQLREQLGQERQINLNLIAQIEDIEGERKQENQRHAEDLDDCKQQSNKEFDRLGRLFASMMQDFANVQSDVSTTD